MKRRILTPSLKAKLAADRETKFTQSVDHMAEFLVLTAPVSCSDSLFNASKARPTWEMAHPIYAGGGPVVLMYKGMPVRMTLHAIRGPLVKLIPLERLQVYRELLPPGTVEYGYINNFLQEKHNGGGAIPLGVLTFDGFPAAARVLPVAILHKTKRD